MPPVIIRKQLQVDWATMIHAQLRNFLQFEYAKMKGSMAKSGAMTDKQFKSIFVMCIAQFKHTPSDMFRDSFPCFK